MDKIDFVNGRQPAINDVNMNQLQDNVENAINIYEPDVLYDSNDGSLSTITLSANSGNYRYIEVYFSRTPTTTFGFTKIYNPNGKRVSLTLNEHGAPIVVYATTIRFSDNKILFGDGAGLALYANNVGDNVTVNGISTTNEIKIFKVLGYK
jgi:hypothetical protein